MPARNNVTRFLDSSGVKYTAYELPAEKLGAVETANLLHVSPEVVFKTIVIKRDRPRRPLLVLIPGTATVDLKLVASAVGEKKVYLPTEREAESLTGLQAGGISPLALLNRGFQVVVDRSAEAHQEIHVSGGQRGLNIKLGVADLVRITHASIHPVGRTASEESDPSAGSRFSP